MPLTPLPTDPKPGSNAPPAPRTPRAPRAWVGTVALAVVLAVACAARLVGLGERSFWFDEGVALGMARLPFADFVRHAWDTGVNNQIFYYLALRPWHALGESEWTIRAFSAAFSVGAVGLTFALGRRLFGGAAGVVAGLVASVSSFEIWQAQQARGYGLAVFLTAASAYLLVRFAGSSDRRFLVAWIAAASMATYAHFFAGFAVAAQVLSLAALGWRALRPRWPAVTAAVVFAALALPIGIYGVGVSKDFVSFIPPLSVGWVLGVFVELGGGEPWLGAFYLAAFATLAVSLARAKDPARRFSTALVLSWALAPAAALTAISLVQPILMHRYVTMSAPAWALAAGAFLGPHLASARIVRRLGAAAVAAVVLVAQVRVLAAYRSLEFEDWRGPARAVAAATRPGDAIVYDCAWAGLPFGYYLDREARRPTPLQPGPLVYTGDFDLAAAAASERVWLVISRPMKAAEIDRALRATHPVVSGKQYGVLEVVLYDARPRAPGEGAFGY